MKTGPIIIIDNDPDDEELLNNVLRDLDVKNRIIWFDRCSKAYDFLCTMDEAPFLIFCDVNLPGQKGIDFKKQVDEVPELRKKSIPFIFYSTSTDPETVTEAYTEMTVQGFFEKKDDYEEIKKTVKIITDYWQAGVHPNSYL